MSDRGLAIAGGGVLIAAVAALFLLDVPGRRLDASPIGFDSLAPWLSAGGVPAARARAGRTFEPQAVALRVIPLWDAAPDAQMLNGPEDDPKTEDPAAWAHARSLREMNAADLRRRIAETPALIVAQKWTGAMVLPGVAAPGTLLDPEGGSDRWARRLGFGGLRIRQDLSGWTLEEKDGRRIALFLPRSFLRSAIPGQCVEEFGIAEGALLLRCEGRGGPVRLLSDPDLLNNAGLQAADNALIARDLLRGAAEGRDGVVLVDPLSEDVVQAPEEDAPPPERTGDELARMFRPPLTAIWAGLIAVLALMFWRGSARFGAAAADDGGGAPGRSRAEALAAEARILRLSGHDGSIAADFVRGRLRALARERLGSEAAGPGFSRLFAHLARRDPKAGPAFRAAAERLMSDGPTMHPATLARALADYAALLKEVTDTDDSR